MLDVTPHRKGHVLAQVFSHTIVARVFALFAIGRRNQSRNTPLLRAQLASDLRQLMCFRLSDEPALDPRRKGLCREGAENASAHTLAIIRIPEPCCFLP